jgi:hypothetical protein
MAVLSGKTGSSKGAYATMTATGSTQAGAATIKADMVMVTAGAAGSGIVLDGMNVEDEVIVCNGVGVGTSTAIDLFVYPKSGGAINNGTANTGILIASGRAVRFRAIDGGGNVIAFF